MKATTAAVPRTDPTAERNAALLAVRKLIYHHARRRIAGECVRPRDIFDREQDVEDLAHDAALLFLEQFDPARGERPEARSIFARLVVRTAYRNRLARRRLDVVPMPVETIAARPTDERATAEELAKLDAALTRLKPTTRKLLSARFGIGRQNGKPLRSLCGGLSRQAAWVRVRSGVKRLRLGLLGSSALNPYGEPS